MATFTPKLNLRKPATTDNISVVTDINDNMDLIDTAFSGFNPGFKNAIRNGDMSVAQRGAGPHNTAGLHGPDGHVTYHESTGTLVATTIDTTLGTDLGVNGADKALRMVVTTASGVATQTVLIHRIEDVRTFAGKQVTLSFMAKAASGTPKIAIATQQRFGSGGAPSANVDVAQGIVTISTVGTKYSLTFTVPSIVGKTLGTDGTDRLEILFFVSAGTNFTTLSSAIGVQNNTFEITDIQLEAGSTATAFERLPQQMQLAWCQRYFKLWNAAAVGVYMITGLAFISTTVGRVVVPISMRATPSLSQTGAFAADGSIAAVVTLSLPVAATSDLVVLDFTSGTAYTQGSTAIIRSSGGAASFSLSAEL